MGFCRSQHLEQSSRLASAGNMSSFQAAVIKFGAMLGVTALFPCPTCFVWSKRQMCRYSPYLGSCCIRRRSYMSHRQACVVSFADAVAHASHNGSAVSEQPDAECCFLLQGSIRVGSMTAQSISMRCCGPTNSRPAGPPWNDKGMWCSSIVGLHVRAGYLSARAA